jgi:SAM-dependent methyltransferase
VAHDYKQQSRMAGLINEDTIRRYESTYHISGVTVDMVKQHWEVETRLTNELKLSTKANRADTFERCYTTLYQLCPWLNSDEKPQSDSYSEFEIFANLLGKARTVYEVGSGKGRLIGFLASRGFKCVASEITRERGVRLGVTEENLRWANSDGVNLGRFEEHNSYDAVISTQVVEHFHPDDLTDHFFGVFEILRPGGKYVFNTPHYLHGPSDLSAVFQSSEAICMHLKEYYYYELCGHLLSAGFENIRAVLVPSVSMRQKLPFYFESRIYLAHVRAVERIGRSLGKGCIPKTILRLMLLASSIFLTATKPR